MSLSFLSPDDLLSRGAIRWLVPGVLHEEALVLLYGATGIGKSFVMLDLACCLAHGLSWPVIPAEHPHVGPGISVLRPVVYWLGEGAPGYGARLAAWRKERLTKGREGQHLLQFLDRRLPLYGERSKATFEALNDALTSLHATHGVPPVLVIDTLASLTPGMNEKEGEDVTALLAGLGRLIEATGATVIVVHHTGKYSVTPRGHSSLTGSPDTVLRLRRVGKGRQALELTVEKQRHSKPAEPLYFRLDERADGASPVPQVMTRHPPMTGRERKQARRDEMGALPAGEKAVLGEIRKMVMPDRCASSENGATGHAASETPDLIVKFDDVVSRFKDDLACGYSQSSVYAAVAALEEKGIVSRFKIREKKTTKTGTRIGPVTWVRVTPLGRNILAKDVLWAK